MKQTKRMAFSSICGLMLFVLIVCLLHFIRPDKKPLSCFVIEYAEGSNSWLMTIAFYALVFSTSFLLIALPKNGKGAVITLGIFCAGILLAAIFLSFGSWQHHNWSERLIIQLLIPKG